MALGGRTLDASEIRAKRTLFSPYRFGTRDSIYSPAISGDPSLRSNLRPATRRSQQLR
jgi:hypothetical protein